VGVHYGLAFATGYWVLRRWGGEVPAAACGAISYAFGGYLLAQHANTPYLVSGAWLPLALYPLGLVVLRLCQTGSVQATSGAVTAGDLSAQVPVPGCQVGHRRTGLVDRLKVATVAGRPWLVGALALALIVLGGDPQTAYHLAIISLPTLLYAYWRLSPVDGPWWTRVPGTVVRATSLWTAWLLCSAVLAGPQIVCSLQWLPESSRVEQATGWRWDSYADIPQRWWQETFGSSEALDNGKPSERQLPNGRGPASANGELARQLSNEKILVAEVGGQRFSYGEGHDRYRFSYPPWRVLEWFCPNGSGRTYPVVRRWTRALGEHEVWFPSTYQGIVPAVAALWALRSIFRCPLIGWSAMVLLGCWLAASGEYGPASCVNAVLGTKLPGEWGGVYWLLVHTLPGYSWFRYPAKWMAIACWFFSVLATFGYQRFSTSSGQSSLRRLLVAALLGALLVSSLVCAGYGWLEPTWRRWLERYTDTAFGPMDCRGAWLDLQNSWLHVAGVLGAALTVVVLLIGRKAMRRASGELSGLAHFALLVVLAFDLACAHAWQQVTIPAQELFDAVRQSPLARELAASQEDALAAQAALGSSPGRSLQQPPIVLLQPSMHVRLPSWSDERAADRLQTLVFCEAGRLVPKYPLLLEEPPSVVPAGGADISSGLLAVLQVASPLAAISSGQDASLERLATLGIQGVVQGDTIHWVADARPFVSIERRVLVIPPVPPSTVDKLAVVTERLLWPVGRDSRVVVESDSDQRYSPGVVPHRQPSPAPAPDVPWKPAKDEYWTLDEFRPGLVRIRGRLVAPAWLVVRQAYAPGWQAIVRILQDNESVYRGPVVRVQRILQGLYVPGGEFTLELTYRPVGWRLCTIAAIVGWLGCGVCLIWPRVRRCRVEGNQAKVC